MKEIGLLKVALFSEAGSVPSTPQSTTVDEQSETPQSAGLTRR